MNVARYYLLVCASLWRMACHSLRPQRRTFTRQNTIVDKDLYNDVVTWQNKQIASMSFEDSVPCPSEGVIDLGKMKMLHTTTLRHVDHQEDGMWKVSTETLQQGKGISLDQSIVLMHRLRDAGFPDHALGVVSVQLKHQRHSFAIIQDTEDDFWMLDNGYFSVLPVRASHFLARRTDIVYLIGFNFFDIWTY
ncbi:MAG: hypothetical protein CSA21_05210 [Deltaproteobacteria bacterium]|nr:MAG: hypothetical protein CSA21_05210 [Deltaproteobacteria bacterium]